MAGVRLPYHSNRTYWWFADGGHGQAPSGENQDTGYPYNGRWVFHPPVGTPVGFYYVTES